MPHYYLIDENKNLVEVENMDENLYTTIVEQLHSQLNGTTHHIEFVTQAQYNQLVADEELVANTMYFITDDTSYEDLEEAIEDIVDGTTIVGSATNAEKTSFTNAGWSSIQLQGSGTTFTDVFSKGKTYQLRMKENNSEIITDIGLITLPNLNLFAFQKSIGTNLTHLPSSNKLALCQTVLLILYGNNLLQLKIAKQSEALDDSGATYEEIFAGELQYREIK